ncbi:hypothetical protein F383_36078 [Gossypium arboreum]|uniref:Uncharacterized protein n=1 Tax=Gossypium arboreum TaxID=29729 RepID=A0A0B0ND33_GOSAR|nr:hypothetical protein F383_36078 [Gossypium arboreum]
MPHTTSHTGVFGTV